MPTEGRVFGARNVTLCRVPHPQEVRITLGAPQNQSLSPSANPYNHPPHSLKHGPAPDHPPVNITPKPSNFTSRHRMTSYSYCFCPWPLGGPTPPGRFCGIRAVCGMRDSLHWRSRRRWVHDRGPGKARRRVGRVWMGTADEYRDEHVSGRADRSTGGSSCWSWSSSRSLSASST